MDIAPIDYPLVITYTPTVPNHAQDQVGPAQIFVYNDDDLDYAFGMLSKYYPEILDNGEYEIKPVEAVH